MTIRNKAFYHLNNLTELGIGFVDYETSKTWFKLNKIESEAFAFEQQSNQTFKIGFSLCNFDDDTFEPGSLDGIQRPKD